MTEFDEGLVRVAFDVAIASGSFSSGFLDAEEVEALRALAVALGVDPWEATPRNDRPKYCPGHQWEPFESAFPDRQTDNAKDQFNKWEWCIVCRMSRERSPVPA